MKITHRYKHCDCKQATASGPRIVATQKREGNAVTFTATLVAMACDYCDTEWKTVRPPRSWTHKCYARKVSLGVTSGKPRFVVPRVSLIGPECKRCGMKRCGMKRGRQ
jgi:hypothetical protein